MISSSSCCLMCQVLVPPITTSINFSSSSVSSSSSSSLMLRLMLNKTRPKRWCFNSISSYLPEVEEEEVESNNYNKVLEWDKVCDSVASFAGTSLGKQATKHSLLRLNSFHDSLRLLAETNAAVQMHNHGSCIMDFHSIPIPLVNSAIQDARRGFPLDGNEAIALVSMLHLADSLQTSLNSAIKQDSIWLQRFLPIADMIIDMSISRSLLKFILKLVDQDGSVKDSAVYTPFL
uniref:DNA mismatch repair protein MSH3 n=1 Tax=Tanacetum cinerariifolium TaxID=118510 RepID=A0A699IXF9_TANCI|nr:DNA mismatch repair protein MSH3 [Tanacetum cinerariifolium]